MECGQNWQIYAAHTMCRAKAAEKCEGKILVGFGCISSMCWDIHRFYLRD